MTIDYARSLPVGTDVTVKGIVTYVRDNGYNLEDDTAAIFVFTNSASGRTIGDEVKVVGKAGDYNGNYQLTSSTATLLASEQPLPAPAEVTSLENFQEYAYQFVTISDLVIVSKESNNRNIVVSIGGFETTVRSTQSSGEVFDFFVERVVGEKLHVTNALTNLYYGNMQIEISSLSEISFTGLTDQEKVDIVAESINYDGKSYNEGTDAFAITNDIYEEVSISWSYDPADAVVDGKFVALNDEDTLVTATATITLNAATTTVTANITVVYVDPYQSVTYTEDFEAQTVLTTGYSDGSFTNDDGITFTYGHSRNEGLGTDDDYHIDGKGIMLRRASDSYLEFTVTDGLKNLTFQYRKAFTGKEARQLEIIINNITVATTDSFGGSSGEDTTIYTFILDETKIYTGSVTVKIKNVGTATSNKQITLDNFSWKSNPQPDNHALVDRDAIEFAKTEYDIADTIVLPTVGSIHSSTITWESSHPTIIDVNGVITLPEETTEVVLTATIYDGTNVETKEFTFTIIGVGTKIQEELNALATIGPSVTTDIILPSQTSSGYEITWSVDVEGSINTTTGTVTRQENDIDVILTATVSSPYTRTREFNIKIIGIGTELLEQLNQITLPSQTTEDITLPQTTTEGNEITWTSSNTDIIDINGTVVRPTDADTTVTMTASVTKDEVTKTKEFIVLVIKEGGDVQPETFTVKIEYLGDRIQTTIPNGSLSSYLTYTQIDNGIINPLVNWDGTDAQTKSIFNNGDFETRLYAGGKLNISVENAQISKIEWTSSRNNGATIGGEATTVLNGSKEFAELVDSVEIVATEGQFRIKTITITYVTTP